MDKKHRTEDFKFGCLHGKLDVENKEFEAHIQRKLFLCQRLKVRITMKDAIYIRLIGYEVPLQSPGRGKCVDLMGYDKDHNLYLIELKRKESKEDIKMVIEQLNDYENIVRGIMKKIEDDFSKEYFMCIKFTGIKKLLIAPREFYNNLKGFSKDETIMYGFFRDKDITKRISQGIVNIHINK